MKKNQPTKIRLKGLTYDLQDAFPTLNLAHSYAQDLQAAGDLSFVRYLGPNHRLKYGVYSAHERGVRKNPLKKKGRKKGKDKCIYQSLPIL